MMMRTESWRSVIRIFAVTMALLGLMLVFNEIWENVTCQALTCAKIHLSTMLWGLTLLSFGLLIIQKGDVSVSLRDLTSTGNSVATWFGRRVYDRKSGKVAVVEHTEETAIVVAPAEPDDVMPTHPARALPRDADEGIEPTP